MKLTTIFIAVVAAAASTQAFGTESHHHDFQHLSSRSGPTEHHHSSPQLSRRHHPGHHRHPSSGEGEQALTARDDFLSELTTRELVEELEARLDIERRGRVSKWIKKKLGFGGGQSTPPPSAPEVGMEEPTM
ncbi:hypothetical protein BJ165DRAFT_1526489 [Panaeolus papilionaceus]|nr:hypothetical protein BJ165DRAFT_1526489 [Panaeolus papilionaceus]